LVRTKEFLGVLLLGLAWRPRLQCRIYRGSVILGGQRAIRGLF
jgi:hypothetical protein